VGIEIARTLYRLYPGDFHPEKLAHLLIHPPTLEAIKANTSLKEIHALWQADLQEFQARRAKYLLY
jgi:hypothetical protein